MKTSVLVGALLALTFAGPAFGLGLTIIQEDASSFAREDLLDAKCAMADQDARDGLRVTVAGQCISSCAFCRPRNPGFCSAPGTELWFHSSPNGVEYNGMLMSVMPGPLQAWVAARGGLKPTFWLFGMSDPNWLVLKGEELHGLVPLCAEWGGKPVGKPQTAIQSRPVAEGQRHRKGFMDALKVQQQLNAVPPVMPPSGSWPRR
jgi:hypothetical protein